MVIATVTGKMASQVSIPTRISSEAVLAGTAEAAARSDDTSSTLQQMMAKSTVMSRTISLSFGGTHMPPAAVIKHDVEDFSTVGVEAAATQNRAHFPTAYDFQALANNEHKQLVGADSRMTKFLPSLDSKKSVGYQHSLSTRSFSNANFSRNTTIADPLETQSLVALTAITALISPSIPDADSASPLLLWIYQTSNDNISTAERLEKSKWETPRLERL